MFYFVTTLRHPDNILSVSATLRLVSLTIESILNQTTQYPFKLLIVCNVDFDIERELGLLHDTLDERIEFLKVDFEAPSTGRGSDQSIDSLWLDKGYKLAAALHYLRDADVKWIYPIDADDWVSTGIVEHVSTNLKSTVDLWYINRGMLLNFDDRTWLRKYGMCRYCGSTFIYDFKTLVDFIFVKEEFGSDRPDVGDPYTVGWLSKIVNQCLVAVLLGNHRAQLGYYSKAGKCVRAVKSESVGWVTNTGENHSGQHTGSIGVNLSSDTLEIYGIKSLYGADRHNGLFFRVLGYVATISSFLGWAITNKTEDKV